VSTDKEFAEAWVSLCREARTDKERETFKYYKKEGNLWYYKNILCVPESSEVRKLNLHDTHNSPITDHAGFIKTYLEVGSRSMDLITESQGKSFPTGI
jgi:hypothetical protein